MSYSQKDIPIYLTHIYVNTWRTCYLYIYDEYKDMPNMNAKKLDSVCYELNTGSRVNPQHRRHEAPFSQ